MQPQMQLFKPLRNIILLKVEYMSFSGSWTCTP